MNAPKGGSASTPESRKKLPVNPSLEHLQKQAKRLVKNSPKLKLAGAQHQLAQEYGFKNWSELIRVVNSMARRHGSAATNPQGHGLIPKAARAADILGIREILAGGDFTQHDLNQGLAHAVWYQEHGTWEDRKQIADLLIEHGADPDGQYGSGGYGPIVFGTGECLHPAGLQYLIDAGADVTFAPVETKYGVQCPMSTWLGTYARGNNERKHAGINILLAHGAYVPPELHPAILAIHCGDTETLAKLIDADPSLPRRHFDDMLYGNMKLNGATLLHCAVEFGEIACIDLLLDRWMEPNVQAHVINGIGGQTPIYHAIAANNLPALEHLVARLDYAIECHRIRATFQVADTVYRTPMTPIEYAEMMSGEEVPVWQRASARELELVRSVVWPGITRKAESEKSPRQVLEEATRAGNFDAVKQLVESRTIAPTELHHGLEGCALSSSTEIAKYLIDHGADINADYIENYGPVLLGLCEGLKDAAVEFVLKFGAKADWEPRDTKYPHHSTPLKMTCETYIRGRNIAKHRILELLLKHGAKPDMDEAVFAIHCGDSAALDRLVSANKELLRKKFPELLGPLTGATLLHVAVEHNEIACCEVLFKHWADINIRSDIREGIGGQTAVFHAARSWLGAGYPTLEYLVKRVGQWMDTSIVAMLEEDGKIVQKTVLEWAGERERKLLQPLDRSYQLRAAIVNEQTETVRQMLDEHPALLTPELWPAAIFQGKSLTMTRLLLKRGLNPNECSAPRKPLHFAVDFGLLDIAKELLAAGADPNVTDGEGFTPLDLYEGLAHVQEPGIKAEITDLLCAAGAKLNVWTCMRIGDTDRALKLLEANPSLVHEASPDLGFVPLHVASRIGNVQLVKWLLEHGASVDAGENTPLWFACQSAAPAADRLAVAKLLLDAGADVHRRCEEGSTALHYAAWRGPVAMVELLLSRNARPWVADDKERTPKEYAMESSVSPDKEEIVRLFSEVRILNPVFREAVSALDTGDVEGLKTLLKKHPNLVHQRAEEEGWFAGKYFCHPTLLHFVANNPYRLETMAPRILESTEAILDAGADIHARTSPENPHTVLGLVTSCEPARKANLQIPLIELLVSRGSDPSSGLDPAVIHGEMDAVQCLLRLGAQHTMMSAAALGEMKSLREHLAGEVTRNARLDAAAAAARFGQIPSIEALLQSGIDINERIAPHPFQPTILHQAAWFGHQALCDWLLERGADPTLEDTQYHGTAADWAQHSGQPDLEKRLREVEKKSSPDASIVRAALKNNVKKLRQLLDKHPEKLGLTGGTWNKPLLHCAAWEGHVEIVRGLIKRGADVNQRCESDHACAIHFAAERGHLEIVRLLLDAGSEIEAADNDHNQSVLGWAIALGNQPDTARFLINRGAKMSIWVAVSLNDSENVRALISADPSLLKARMSRNEHFRTVLHHAVARNLPDMVSLLLELGADPDARDAMGLGLTGQTSPASDAEILAQLEDPQSPLSLYDLLAQGRFDDAGELIANNPDCVRAGGSEARVFVYAVCRQNWDAAQWLHDRGADINAIAEVYQCPATALHFSIESAPLEKIQWLLDRGADTTIPDGKYGADALGWAEFLGKSDVEALIISHRKGQMQHANV